MFIVIKIFSLFASPPQNTVGAYIRLFEPLVIKSLKMYTMSSSVALQTQVLNLLVQLIQLRVNYCLLDNDEAGAPFYFAIFFS